MTKTEFREAVRSLLSQGVAELSLDEKTAIVRQCLVDIQEYEAFDESAALIYRKTADVAHCKVYWDRK